LLNFVEKFFNMDFPFTHLHVHSQYSILDGQASIKGLVDRALQYGMKGIALTDHGNMFGIKEFYNYVAKINSGKPDEEKFKPILGCEMYVAKDRLTDRGDKSDNGYHLIVLAKNKTGYKNLIKLVSKAWTDGHYYKPRTDRTELELHREGLIICSACLGGEIPQFIMDGDIQKASERVKWYKDTFGDDYYIELQRHKTDKPNANTETFREQQEVNKILLELAKQHGVKYIASNDVHFVDEDDAEAHDRLICVSMQKTFSEPRLHYTKQEWLKSTEQMQSVFSDLPEAIANTREILDKVEFYSIDHAAIMPNFQIPEEFGSEEDYRKRLTEEDLFNEFTRDENGNVVLSPEKAQEKIDRLGGYEKLYRIKFEADYLAKLAYEGAHRLYGNPLPEDVDERIRFELYIMKTMGFPGYFLIVQDFINAARSKLGVSVGPGRGSAAGSVVAYCLGITQIDPIKYDLLFERFLNPDRISMPDIDVDFDDDGRAAVLNYVTEKYGADKVAHIITYNTMATKMVIKDVAKVMELPLPEANRLAKMIPAKLPEVDGKAPKVNFQNCLKYVKELNDEATGPNPLIREVLKYAGKLEGNVRGTGIHACGVIIGRDPITDWVPVSTAKDTDGQTVIATQYEGSVIEETGLIKMDFLGLKTLSIIKDVVENIKRTRGIDIDMEKIPLDDAPTYKLYCEGRTTGTFQFESPGMQKHLRSLQPSKFEDLIAMNALYRPGPMDYIPQFINRKQGREPIVYDIPIMEKYLSETYGITVYQEQVMLLSRLLANFTRGESDMLRKAMGKKQIDKMAKLKVKFMAEGQKNGHAEEVLEKIWADWEKFASYAFNKSHATCYSWVAYQTGYLKANYPAEYMAGVLSRNLTVPDKLSKFMDECKTLNIPVKGPDVNESTEKFGVNKSGEIRFGLGGIKGLGANAVASIIYEREQNGPYKDIYDFVERVNLSACNKSAIESLALSGGFDSFEGLERQMFVTEMGSTTFSDILVKYGQRFQADKNSLQGNLFDAFDTVTTARPPYPEIKEPWTDIKRLEEEKKLVTMYLSSHPLDPYYMELTYGTTNACTDIHSLKAENQTIFFGGLVTSSETKMSQKGTPFGIVSIEDFSGKCEIRLFGKTFQQFKDIALTGTLVMVKAQVSPNRNRPEYPDLRVMDIRYLSDLSGTIANTITIDVPVDGDMAEIVSIFDESIAAAGDDSRKGILRLNLKSSGDGRSVKVQSRRKLPLDKHLLTMLDEGGFEYKVNTVRDS